MKYLLIAAMLTVCCGAKLPTPRFRLMLPVPRFDVIHTAKPTIKPVVLTHSRTWMACQCGQPMCVGQHLRNEHGITNAQWNKLKLWQGSKMDDLHAKLHREGVYEKPKDGCPGGVCRPPVRPVRRLLGRWR